MKIVVANRNPVATDMIHILTEARDNIKSSGSDIRVSVKILL